MIVTFIPATVPDKLCSSLSYKNNWFYLLLMPGKILLTMRVFQ
jgi:hypothetical protein